MKMVMKFAAGFALATMAVAQPALAAPRAMDATVSAASAEVVGVRQSATVGATNFATQGEMRRSKHAGRVLAALAAAAAGVGLYFALHDSPASP